MHVIILGAPGSGKGTQSAKMIEKYALHHLSTGDMLRAEIAAGSELGKAAKSIIDKGDLVSDEIILGMVANKVKSVTDKHVLFDGFPRTLAQAEGLDNLLAELDTGVAHVIQLEVPFDTITERMLARGRADDNETSIRNRLDVFNKQTAPLIDYYQKQGKLSVINGLGSVDEIYARIETVLDK